jgi:hypothetical protein
MFSGSTAGSPCPGALGKRSETAVVELAEWRTLGKPSNYEEYATAAARVESGERREFQRFEVCLDVRISRMPSWRNSSPQAEDTATDVVARGGALVRSRMAVEKGEILLFEVGGSFKTRAEIVYVSAGSGDAVQRLGLRFLDAPLPDVLIPADAPIVP